MLSTHVCRIGQFHPKRVDNEQVTTEQEVRVESDHCPLARRLDMVDPYRFMGPHLANLLPSPAHLQSLIQTSRLPLSSSTHFPPIKANETVSRYAFWTSLIDNQHPKSPSSSSMQEPIEKKSEVSALTRRPRGDWYYFSALVNLARIQIGSETISSLWIGWSKSETPPFIN